MLIHGGLVHNILENQDIAPGSGSANVAGAAVDMQGWDGVAFYLTVGAITGAGTYSGYVQSALDGDSGFNTPTNVTDAGNSAQAILPASATTANTVAVIDVWRPSGRYVKFQLVVAVNTVQYAVTSYRYRRTGLLPPRAESTSRVIIRAN